MGTIFLYFVLTFVVSVANACIQYMAYKRLNVFLYPGFFGYILMCVMCQTMCTFNVWNWFYCTCWIIFAFYTIVSVAKACQLIQNNHNNIMYVITECVGNIAYAYCCVSMLGRT